MRAMKATWVFPTIFCLLLSPCVWGKPPAEFYGCPWNADGLANLEIGKYAGRAVSYRFRAKHSGKVDRVMIFLVFRLPGYYRGDGGQVLLTVQTDDDTPNHNPSGQILASALVKDPMKVWHRLFVLDRPARLTRDRLYHLVFTNPAPDPVNNFVSIDNLYNERCQPNMQPAFGDLDLAVLLKNDSNSPWQINYGHTPIFCLFYTHGPRQGQGYIDAMSTSVFRISGESKVREVFTVSGPSRTVSEVSVRLKKTGHPGDLYIRLALASGGPPETDPECARLIGEVRIPASSVKTTYSWVTGKFRARPVLQAGQTYYLILSAPPGDHYEIFPLQEGLPYGFESPNLFADGYFQFSTGSTWEEPRAPGRKDFDMQFYFTPGRGN